MLGFSFVMPFLPDFLEKLGIEDRRKLLVWAGLTGAAPAWTMFIFAPIWGVVADKIGRKAMVMRAMFGGFVIIGMMGFAKTPLMLFMLRVLQGSITGTVPASNALVSSVTPAKRASFTLGIMQAAVHAGHLLGPLIGGYAADVLGYRRTFFIAASLLLAGGFLVLFCADEGPAHPRELVKLKAANGGGGLMEVLRQPGFAVLVGITFTAAFSRMVLSPIFLPYVKTLIPPGSTMIKTITGSLIATTAASTMITAVVGGRLADRYGPKIFLVGGTMLAGAFCIPQAFVGGVSQLYALRVMIGIGTGMVAPAIGGLVNRLVPRESQGKAFGLLQSSSSLGIGLAPVTGGFIGANFGMTAAFVFTGSFQICVGVLALILLALLPAHVRNGNGGGEEKVPPEEGG